MQNSLELDFYTNQLLEYHNDSLSECHSYQWFLSAQILKNNSHPRCISKLVH